MKLAAMTEASEGRALYPLSASPLFAHQGGWDEILIVAIPLLLIATLLFIANRRVDAKLAERSTDEGQPRS